MKTKFLTYSVIALIAIAGAIYGFTLRNNNCDTAQVNCPKNGHEDCAIIKSKQSQSPSELANCPLAGTADCPLVKDCPKKGKDDCPYVKSEDNSLAINSQKEDELAPCCRKNAGH
jgi:hypothetical protein